MNTDFYYLLDRLEVKSGQLPVGFHSSLKPYERKGVAELADSMYSNRAPETRLSRSDRDNISYIQHDNSEWTANDSVNHSRRPIGPFYRRPADIIRHHDAQFDLHANPVFYFQAGKQQGGNTGESVPTYFTNTRGVEVRGLISGKVGFYSYLSDNQCALPAYALQFAGNMMPGEGFWKRYKPEKYGLNGFDYLSAKGYITFDAVKNIHLQFGYDKNVIGNGYRSLVLSDYANNYLFLKINTRVWKLNYQNLFARLNYNVPLQSSVGSTANVVEPVKYMALHSLSMNIGRNLNIGLFESIIFGPRGADSSKGALDLTYLNPIIFYRYAESNNGSPDNVNLGLDFKWNLFRRLSLYGQLNLDEFLLKEVTAGKGWWANKQAAQAGLKYFDVAGISNLDLQLEYNYIRPFTYSHETNKTSYTHYNMALAHPMGANLRELVGILRYQPCPKLYFTGKLIYSKQGASGPGYNFGTDPTTSYTTRNEDYNYKTGIGAYTLNTTYTDLTLSYRLRHNLFIDLKEAIYKSSTVTDASTGAVPPFTAYSAAFTSFAVRLNIAQRVQQY